MTYSPYKPVQALSFAKVHLGPKATDYELVGGPQEAIDILSMSVESLPGIEYEVISKEEAYVELYLSKVGAGCFIQHEFDIIANEHRRARSSSILMSLARRLGVGVIFHPVGFVIDSSGIK
jgi:hypothetical protein